MRACQTKNARLAICRTDGMDGMGLVIIGNRSSKSTFGANNYVVHMYILKKIFGVSR